MFWKLKCHFLIEIKSFDHMFFIPLKRPDLRVSFDVWISLWELPILSSILTICCLWLRAMFFCWVKTQETLSPVWKSLNFLPLLSNLHIIGLTTLRVESSRKMHWPSPSELHIESEEIWYIVELQTVEFPAFRMIWRTNKIMCIPRSSDWKVGESKWKLRENVIGSIHRPKLSRLLLPSI